MILIQHHRPLCQKALRHMWDGHQHAWHVANVKAEASTTESKHLLLTNSIHGGIIWWHSAMPKICLLWNLHGLQVILLKNENTFHSVPHGLGLLFYDMFLCLVASARVVGGEQLVDLTKQRHRDVLRGDILQVHDQATCFNFPGDQHEAQHDLQLRCQTHRFFAWNCYKPCCVFFGAFNIFNRFFGGLQRVSMDVPGLHTKYQDTKQPFNVIVSTPLLWHARRAWSWPKQGAHVWKCLKPLKWCKFAATAFRFLLKCGTHPWLKTSKHPHAPAVHSFWFDTIVWPLRHGKPELVEAHDLDPQSRQSHAFFFVICLHLRFWFKQETIRMRVSPNKWDVPRLRLLDKGVAWYPVFCQGAAYLLPDLQSVKDHPGTSHHA